MASEVTRLLRELGGDQQKALDRLMPLVYDELHALAGRFLRGERPGHTLQTTALAHEAYLRLVDQDQANWQDRNHFLSVAATAIRRILVDHARRQSAAKRGGDMEREPLRPDAVIVTEHNIDVIALDEALAELSKNDPRKARVVELRYFVGMTHKEIAGVLAVSVPTVDRDWAMAQAWLYRALSGESSNDH